jgi:hypothetical protein
VEYVEGLFFWKEVVEYVLLEGSSVVCRERYLLSGSGVGFWIGNILRENCFNKKH